MFRRIHLILFFLIFQSGLSQAQQVINVNHGTGPAKEILLLPFYPEDTSFLRDLGLVKNSHTSKKHHDFNAQLNDIAEQTIKTGGNVFQLNWMQDHKQSGDYRIRGEAFHTDKYDEVKSKALIQKKKSLENNKCAILTVYRPVYNFGHNDEIAFDLIINDTLKLEMKGNTKYIIKVAGNINVKISNADKSIVQHINVEPGNNYYVRAYTNFPGSDRHIKVGDMMVRMRGYDPYFEIMDDVQGDLESSLVNKITIISKKI